MIPEHPVFDQPPQVGCRRAIRARAKPSREVGRKRLMNCSSTSVWRTALHAGGHATLSRAPARIQGENYVTVDQTVLCREEQNPPLQVYRLDEPVRQCS